LKLRELLAKIEGIAKKNNIATPMICGGAVREKFMGTLTKLEDIDITNGESSIKNLAKEVELDLGRTFSVKSKLMDDGHTSIFLGGLKLDFSSNFILPNIDGELLKKGVKNPTNLMREAYSRDFTCNSLLMDFGLNKISDPTKMGAKDIKSKIIRTCVDPEITLKYNVNRIIRVIYLSAKLGFAIDPKIIDFIKNNKDLLAHIDPGYITKNLNKAAAYGVEKTAESITSLDLWKSLPIPESLYAHYPKGSKTAQLKRNMDYGEGFYANMPDYKSISDYRRKNKKKRKKVIKKIKDMKLASKTNLYSKLNELRSQFAVAAQHIVDGWLQDEDGISEDLGSGGVCDQVAQAMGSVISSAIPEVDLTDGGHDGDDHAFIVVYNDAEAFGVDISPGVYETGGGYNWKKIQGAKIDPSDIDIWKIDRRYLGDIEKQAYYTGIDEYDTDNFPIVLNDDLESTMDRKENDPAIKAVEEQDKDEGEDGGDTGETLLNPSDFSGSMYSSMHGDEGLFAFPLAEHVGKPNEEDSENVVNNPYNNIYQSNGLLESINIEEMANLFTKLAIK
jgi:tRNA nucleotidyltransferase/poly(A) polymerase